MKWVPIYENKDGVIVKVSEFYYTNPGILLIVNVFAVDKYMGSIGSE